MFFHEQEHDQICVALLECRWKRIAQLFKLKCKTWMRPNSSTCVHASRKNVNGHWFNFPGTMSCNKALWPVRRRTPAKPQLLLLKPNPLSTFVFASSSLAWARRGAEEPRLQAARLWKGLTCFQDACCLNVQACQQAWGPSEWARHELNFKSCSRCVGIDCSGRDSMKLLY